MHKLGPSAAVKNPKLSKVLSFKSGVSYSKVLHTSPTSSNFRFLSSALMEMEVLLHLIQRPCYQRESPCQDPAGNLTTRRPPGHRKETQTAVVWTCLPFIRSGQNHLARHSEKGEEDKANNNKKEVERQHQGMDRPGVLQVAEGSGEQRKMEETGCEISCGAQTTLVVKE